MTNATWQRIFDPLEPVHAFVAERDEALIGFSHYLFQRSTWLLNPQCYLQDLYVAEAKRGCGVGRALIAAVVGAAKDAGAARVFWNTQETNAVARRLYDAVAERTDLYSTGSNRWAKAVGDSVHSPTASGDVANLADHAPRCGRRGRFRPCRGWPACGRRNA